MKAVKSVNIVALTFGWSSFIASLTYCPDLSLVFQFYISRYVLNSCPKLYLFSNSVPPTICYYCYCFLIPPEIMAPETLKSAQIFLTSLILSQPPCLNDFTSNPFLSFHYNYHALVQAIIIYYLDCYSGLLTGILVF